MTTSAYVILWSVYLFSAAACLLFGWLVLRRLLGWSTLPLLLPVAALLLVPARVAEDQSMLAPAFIVAVFDELSGEPDGWTRAGVYVVIGLAATLLASVVWLVVGGWRRWRNRRANRSDS